MIEQKLLDILACPLGKADLEVREDKLVCTQCGLKFKVEDGIPVMLIEEAELPEGVKSIEELKCSKPA